jgi:glycosyltransferase involved in cell wall biosynthesis
MLTKGHQHSQRLEVSGSGWAYGSGPLASNYTSQMRLAWFSPWTPQASGVAGRSAELVPLLSAAGHAIDVFVDEGRVHVDPRRPPDGPPSPGDVRVQSAHDFVWRQARHQFDLVVYQVGNSTAHEYMWPYLFRWPGLTVLHDARLHHARGHADLSRGSQAAYRAEFARNHPEVNVDAAELAIAGFDVASYYQWPMVRSVLLASRAVAAHARGALDDLQQFAPGRRIEYIALGEGTHVTIDDARRRAWRARHGFADGTVVFGAFGRLSAEKRVPALLRAFAATRARVPAIRLVLAGARDPGLDLPDLVRALDLEESVSMPGPLDDRDFDEAIGCIDVSVNLRWPSAIETSGPWLRALSAGRPTIIIDLPHLAHLPALDPRTWRPHAWPDANPRDHGVMTVAIDILDEEHSLRLALHRLAVDPALRASIGEAGYRYWQAEHTVARMAADYERVLALAATEPLGQPLPGDVDPLSWAAELVEPFGKEVVASVAALRTDR